MQKFIFGYGSLHNFNSIKKTIFADKDIVSIQSEFEGYDNLIQIVRVKNLRRGWFFHCSKSTNKLEEPYTALGAYECEDGICNGTLFPVSEEQLILMDLRELGYIRKVIDPININIIKGLGIKNDAIIYYYSVDQSNIKNPSPSYPISQTYVDLCMLGCLQVDKLIGNKNYQYTYEFVNTTFNWKNNKFWINNRKNTYVESQKFIEHLDLIDKILETNLFN